MSVRRGEWLAVAFWAALGSAILIGSWRMDRLGHQGISPLSAPGLLPGVVGALMLVFAAVLAVQLWRSAPVADGTGDARAGNGGLGPGALAAALCLAFAGLALGHGWPFQLEAALFVLVFTTAFSWSTWRSEGRVASGLATAATIAGSAAIGIGALFERVFLVRLP
jgi:hypothetical protein